MNNKIVIVLPGYSSHNKEWAYEVKKNLEPSFEVFVHEWSHWQNKEEGDWKKMNINDEVKKILGMVGNKKVSFVAKSVGTKVLMSVIPKIKKQIEKVILCGIPIDPIGYAGPMKMIDTKNISIFQNSGDPFMPYKAIKIYLGLVDKNIKVVEREANNHDYPYFADFKEFLK